MVERPVGFDHVVPFVPPLPESMEPIDVSGLVPPPPAAPRRVDGYVGEVLAWVPLLSPEEVDHYRWLIRGLVDGARRLSALEDCSPTVTAALGGAVELFDELVARIPPVALPEEVR